MKELGILQTGLVRLEQKQRDVAAQKQSAPGQRHGGAEGLVQQLEAEAEQMQAQLEEVTRAKEELATSTNAKIDISNTRIRAGRDQNHELEEELKRLNAEKDKTAVQKGKLSLMVDDLHHDCEKQGMHNLVKESIRKSFGPGNPLD